MALAVRSRRGRPANRVKEEMPEADELEMRARVCI
jgi:hypothetical protein